MRRKKSQAEKRLAEVERAHRAVVVARNHFEYAETVPQVDRSITELITAEACLRAALQKLRREKSA